MTGTTSPELLNLFRVALISAASPLPCARGGETQRLPLGPPALMALPPRVEESIWVPLTAGNLHPKHMCRWWRGDPDHSEPDLRPGPSCSSPPGVCGDTGTSTYQCQLRSCAQQSHKCLDVSLSPVHGDVSPWLRSPLGKAWRTHSCPHLPWVCSSVFTDLVSPSVWVLGLRTGSRLETSHGITIWGWEVAALSLLVIHPGYC